ncbi:MAG: hypothetical protein FWD13_01220 [Treponema sp.]|nr:hypothetical protein [Treponema sp.]
MEKLSSRGSGDFFLYQFVDDLGYGFSEYSSRDFSFIYRYYFYMKQTVTLNINDNTVLLLLRNLAALKMVEFASEIPSQDDLITAHLNEVYKEVDSSLDPDLVRVQAEALGSDDW